MKSVLGRLAGLAVLGLASTGAAWADWTRTYVIEWYEPAHYYGAKDGVAEPGTDCPKGSNGEPNWIKVLTDAGYTDQEARWIRDLTHPFRVPNHGQNQMAFRGPDRINVYAHPEQARDPGLVGVTGKTGEGLDLDGNVNTGFTSPKGERGIDNAFYRTAGCWKNYRGPPRQIPQALYHNDEMREGAWTVVVVVSGEGDTPANDENVLVGFYGSPDKLIKDGNGNIAWGYTFRIEPHAKFEGILKARTVNGEIISTEPAEEIWIRDPAYPRELQMLKARLKLKMEADGRLTGLLAGYRPWRRIYDGFVEARGQITEQLSWIELPGLYHALKRNADYSPTGPQGERTHISTAMRIEAIPAFVMTPDAKAEVAKVVSYKSIAPPMPPQLHAFITNKFNVTDGLVPNADGVILAGPHVVIPPPTSVTASLQGTIGE
jgi:hypothetical protein